MNFARRLLTALRDSIEADLSTANETEVSVKGDSGHKPAGIIESVAKTAASDVA